MDTNSQIRVTSAAVIGSRHLKAARNGQDAAAVWKGEGAGAVVVCDGCGSGASSEVGARLGAQLVIAALARELEAGGSPANPLLWERVRGHVVLQLDAMVNTVVGKGPHLGCDGGSCPLETRREAFIREHLLFTIVAAAVSGDDAAVWSIGDGAYAIGGRTRELGPCEDNQPPYLAYDLMRMPRQAHLEVVSAAAQGAIVVATDGVAEVGLDVIAIERCLEHPDALRRRLALLARCAEKIEWDSRRVVRSPAALQDDGAAAILAWSGIRGEP